jgi:hypothetical protein
MESGSSNDGTIDPTAPSGSSSDSSSGSAAAATRPAVGGSILGGSLIGGDWPAQAADTIVTTVEKVRDRTTVPLMKLARGTVYGVFIVTVALVVLTLVVIGLVRVLDIVLPSGVWLAYLVLGAATTLGGWLLYRKRNEPAAPRGGKGSGR